MPAMRLFACLLLVALAACDVVVGVDDFVDAPVPSATATGVTASVVATTGIGGFGGDVGGGGAGGDAIGGGGSGGLGGAGGL